jgi:hypothetical protein
VLNAAFAFGMTFLRDCYHQILGPRRHLPKFSVDRMPPNLRLSDELIDLMKDFSLSTGYRWWLGDTAAPIDALRRALRAMVKSACPRRTNKGSRPHADEVIQGRRRGIIVFR